MNRAKDDGTVEPGFRVFFAGGLGANPHPAQALEEFTSREDLLPTIEAILRTFDHYGNRDNKLRARMKWLVDTMGWDELQCVFATVFVDELEAVASEGGRAALRGRLARLSEDERRLLRDELAAISV